MPRLTEGTKKNWERLRELEEANRVKKLNREYNQMVETATTNLETPENSGGFLSSITEKLFGGDESRKRIAASKNNISNKQLNNMLEKNLSKEQAKNLQRYDKADLGLNLSHLTGKNVDAGGKEIGVSAEKVAEHKKMLAEPRRGHWSEGSAYDYPERSERAPWNLGPSQGVGDGYPAEVVKETQPVPEPVPEPVPKQVPPQLGEDGFAQSEKSYEDYRESDDGFAQSEKSYEDYQENVQPKGILNLGEDGFAQSEKSYDEENPVQSEMKHLTKTIIEGTPKEKKDALEFRKEAFAHLSPRETALAKEETGNYWIDPISGVAINIDMIEADGKRKSNWLMLEKLPEHARPYFMAKFGYLDAEDVDGMPIDPKLKIAEMNVQAKKLELESLEKRHGQSIDVQYAQITGKSELHASNLKWEREKYNGLSRAQQEELQIKQYNQVRSNVDMLLKNGQYESGMLLGQGLGIPYIQDMKGFWRSKAKTTDIDPVFGMALRGSGLEGLSKKAAGTAYYKAIGDYWSKLNAPNKDPEMKISFFEAKAQEHGLKLWNQLSDEERKGNNPMLHNNTIRTQLLKDLMLADPKYGTLHKQLNDARAQANLGGRGGGTGTGTGTDKKGPPKSKKLTKTSDKLTKKDPKLLEATSPVEELKDMDTKYEFGAEKYTAELAGKILGLGKWDYDQYDSFMDYRNSKEGLREISKKNLGPGKVKKKLEGAYRTGKKGFEKILAKEKKSNNPRFTSIKEAAVYYNKKSGIFFDRREGHELRNDVKYYISRNLK